MLDIVTEKIARRDGGQLRESREETLGLGSFANPGRTDEDHAGRSAKAHSMEDESVRRGFRYTLVGYMMSGRKGII